MAIAMQQLSKYAEVLEPLLDISPCATMEVLLEAVFSMWLAPQPLTQLTELSWCSGVQQVGW